MSNLVNKPEYAQIQHELDARITENITVTGDDWDLEMHFPPPDFLTHSEAKENLLNVVKPSAIEVS